VGGLVGNFLGSYLKKRGENLATKEDFNDLLRQAKESTQATEEIRHELSKITWVDQKRWDLKREIYSEILLCLNKIDHILIINKMELKVPGTFADCEKEGLKLYIDRLNAAISVGALFLKEDTQKILFEMNNEILKMAGGVTPARDSIGLFEKIGETINKAQQSLIRTAKDDLILGKISIK
jgi:hypothetical protein